MDRKLLLNAGLKCGLHLTRDQIEQTQRYLLTLRKWNSRISLTSVQKDAELVEYHVLEAFWACDRFLRESGSVVDIGSGAGFPGLALKIWRPELDICLIERVRKKSVFLKSVARELGFHIQVFSRAAEDFQDWSLYDCASCRAVVPTPRLLEELERAKRPLLLFHTGEDPNLPEPWTILHQELFPRSLNRRVSWCQTSPV